MYVLHVHGRWQHEICITRTPWMLLIHATKEHSYDHCQTQCRNMKTRLLPLFALAVQCHASDQHLWSLVHHKTFPCRQFPLCISNYWITWTRLCVMNCVIMIVFMHSNSWGDRGKASEQILPYQCPRHCGSFWFCPHGNTWLKDGYGVWSRSCWSFWGSVFNLLFPAVWRGISPNLSGQILSCPRYGTQV